ncbi:MAG: preprotein translocase subunit SecE [Planctomycetota bacterium]
MAYKPDQGRYARMASFWALFLLLAYGCLDGMVVTLRDWFDAGDPWAELPLVGDIDLAKVISIGVLLAGGLLISRTLNRPKTADLLIDTENELKKVTWPTPNETWVGSVAVIVTVLVMLFFLFGSDLLLTNLVGEVLKTGG